MNARPHRRDREEIRGFGLPLVMVLLIILGVIYTVAMDRTVAETPEVLGYYFDGVALDLAEDGVVIAGRRIASGAGMPAGPVTLGEFRGLTGTVTIQAEPQGGGVYRVISDGVLSSPSRKTGYARRVSCLGSVVSGRFTVSQWEEPPGE